MVGWLEIGTKCHNAKYLNQEVRLQQLLEVSEAPVRKRWKRKGSQDLSAAGGKIVSQSISNSNDQRGIQAHLGNLWKVAIADLDLNV
jgi:hypothetical protein